MKLSKCWLFNWNFTFNIVKAPAMLLADDDEYMGKDFYNFMIYSYFEVLDNPKYNKNIAGISLQKDFYPAPI